MTEFEQGLVRWLPNWPHLRSFNCDSPSNPNRNRGGGNFFPSPRVHGNSIARTFLQNPEVQFSWKRYFVYSGGRGRRLDVIARFFNERDECIRRLKGSD